MNNMQFLTSVQLVHQFYAALCLPIARKYDINQSGIDILMFLHNNPQFNTARDISSLRGLKKGIISVTVEQLIQSGYLRRENDAADRRVQRLCLTDAAAPIIAEGAIAQQRFGETIFQDFSAEERRAFAASIERFAANIRGQAEREDS